MEQIYPPKQDYKVLVRCFTYNQSKYIEDALNGFAMQKTDFPFVCLVMDDCSTDGEQEVIKAWMERECDMERAEYVDIEPSHIILVPHKTNKSCTFAFYLLKKNLYINPLKKELINPWREHCEYEALCEGDDYWTEPLKLQKQYNFLEGHGDYVMCTHDFLKLHEENKALDTKPYYALNETVHFEEKEGIKRYDYDISNYGDGPWVYQPLSLMIRTSVFHNQIPEDKYKFYRDNIQTYYYLKCGKGTLLADCMGVYRINEGGIFSSLSDFKFRKIDFINRMTLYHVEKDNRLLPSCYKNFKYAWDILPFNKHILKEIAEIYGILLFTAPLSMKIKGTGYIISSSIKKMINKQKW